MMAACSPTAPPTAAPSVLEAPDQGFNNAWFDVSAIGLAVLNDPRPGATVVVVHTDGGQDTVTVPEQHGCNLTTANSPHKRPDGLLGLVVVCDLSQGFHMTLAAREEDGTVRSITDLPGDRRAAAIVAWSPDSKDALVALGGTECSGLVLVAVDGSVTVPDWEVVGSGGSYSTADPEAMSATSGCSETGRTTAPTWSAATDQIAFMGSTDAIGKIGPERSFASSDIYVTRRGASATKVVLTGIENAAGLDWSPDGTALTFGGRLGGQNGLWTVSAAGGSPRLIWKGEVFDASWSPSGDAIAAVVKADRGPIASDLIIVQVPPK